MFSYEGYMSVIEGNKSNYIEDYHLKELNIAYGFENDSLINITFSHDFIVEDEIFEMNYDDINFDIFKKFLFL